VLALALAPDGVERGVRAAHEVEVVDHDPRPRKHRPDRLAVGLVGIDRDHLDRTAVRLRERAQVALHAPAAATVEHLHHAPAVEIGHHRRELPAAAVMRLVERQPPRRAPRPRRQLLGTVAKGTRDLVARGGFLARHLCVGGTPADAREQPPAKAPRDPLARRQLRVLLGERPAARPAQEAALAPHQIGPAARQRQVAHPHPRALLHLERAPPAAGAQAGPRDQLDFEVEPVANLDNALHHEPFQPDETGKVILHPLLLLAPRSMTTQSLQRAADVSFSRPSTPAVLQDPVFQPALTG
jgi:hypothetical protein